MAPPGRVPSFHRECGREAGREVGREPRLGKRDVAAGADHDMVVHRHVEELSYGDHLCCDRSIVGGWGRVATRVVVHEDDRGGAGDDRGPEDLPWMDEGGVEDAS